MKTARIDKRLFESAQTTSPFMFETKMPRGGEVLGGTLEVDVRGARLVLDVLIPPHSAEFVDATLAAVGCGEDLPRANYGFIGRVPATGRVVEPFVYLFHVKSD